MLDTLITSRVRLKIIERYARYPEYKTHVRGLSSSLREDVGNVWRELKRLEKAGFLVATKKNNTKIYTVNHRLPIFRELQIIVLKSRNLSRSTRPIGS